MCTTRFKFWVMGLGDYRLSTTCYLMVTRSRLNSFQTQFPIIFKRPHFGLEISTTIPFHVPICYSMPCPKQPSNLQLKYVWPAAKPDRSRCLIIYCGWRSKITWRHSDVSRLGTIVAMVTPHSWRHRALGFTPICRLASLLHESVKWGRVFGEDHLGKQ